MQTDDMLHVVSFTSSCTVEPDIEAVLEATDMQVVSWTRHGGETTSYDIFEPDTDHAEATAARVQALLSHAGITLVPPPTVHQLAQQDWQTFWKRFFHVDRVSPHVVICPSWESYEAEGGDCVIEMDPGMSFGTGQHATTRACIQFLDTMASTGMTGSFLDAGCGSGILAITAAKLGFGPIDAFDYDEDAVRIASENAATNETSGAIRLATVDLLAYTPTRTYDIVAANILAPVLTAGAERIARALAPTPAARLILSGILREQYDDVRACVEALGLVEVDTIDMEEWRSGIFALQCR